MPAVYVSSLLAKLVLSHAFQRTPGCLYDGHEHLHTDRLKIVGSSSPALSACINQSATIYRQNERNTSKRSKSHR